MNILVAHNHYKQRGGEDIVFESEVDLLSRCGHEVHTLEIWNNDIKSVRAKVGALLGTAHNRGGIATVLQAVQRIPT